MFFSQSVVGGGLDESILIEPAEHNNYVNSKCNDLCSLICNDLLYKMQRMMSLLLCPLQTPKICEPHHVENVQEYKKEMIQEISRFSQSLQDIKRTVSNKLDINKAQHRYEKPNTKKLIEFAGIFRNHTVIGPRLKHIDRLIWDTYANCDEIWMKRKKMHENIKKVFEETIRNICNYIITMHQSLSPDLVNFLETRQQDEQILYHSKHKSSLEYYQAERRKLYDQALQFARDQTIMFKNMLNVLRILINEKRNEATGTDLTYDRYLSEYRSMDKSLNIWLQVLESHSEMSTPLPILQTMLNELKQLLIKFQTVMCDIMSEYETKLPTPIIPDPPVSSSMRNQTDNNNSNNNNKTLLFSGILPVQPKLFDFLVNVRHDSNIRFQEKEKENVNAIANASNLQRQILMMKEEIQKNLSEKSLNDIIETYNEAVDKANLAIASREQASKFHSQQFKAQRYLQQLYSQQELITKHIQELAPKIANEKSLISSLNTIIGTLNAFSEEYQQNWIKMIEYEEELCDHIKLHRIQYHTGYLQFRATTRETLDFLISAARQDLTVSIEKSFLNLTNNINFHLSKLREAVEPHKEAIAEHRSVIDVYHRDISDPGVNDVYNISGGGNDATHVLNNPITKVSNEIASLKQYLDYIITFKDQQDWLQYVLDTQDMFLIFSASLEQMVTVLLQDEILLKYITNLDEICLKHNSIGTAPNPRMTTLEKVNRGDILNNWVQIAEYPDSAHGITMYTGSNMEKRDAENFVLKKKGLDLEPDDIKASETNISEIIQKYTNLYKK